MFRDLSLSSEHVQQTQQFADSRGLDALHFVTKLRINQNNSKLGSRNEIRELTQSVAEGSALPTSSF